MTRRKLQASTTTPINPPDNLIRETTKNTIGVLYKQQQHTHRPSSLHLQTAIQTSPLHEQQWPVLYTSFLLYCISLSPSCSYTTQKNTLLQAKIRCYKPDHPINTAIYGSRFSQPMHRRVFQYFHLAVSDLTVRVLACMQLLHTHIRVKTCVWRNNEMGGFMSRSGPNVPSNS